MKNRARPRWVNVRVGDCRDAPWRVSIGVAYTWNVYLLFFFAQLLIPLVSQFRELLGLGEEFLGLGRALCCRSYLIIRSNFVFHFSQWGSLW